MTAELVVWIVIAVAIVVVALWPLLSRRRTAGASTVWTEEQARDRIAELEAELDLLDLPAERRAAAERKLLLAGAALADGGRRAAQRAGTHAADGLALLRPQP